MRDEKVFILHIKAFYIIQQIIINPYIRYPYKDILIRSHKETPRIASSIAHRVTSSLLKSLIVSLVHATTSWHRIRNNYKYIELLAYEMLYTFNVNYIVIPKKYIFFLFALNSC